MSNLDSTIEDLSEEEMDSYLTVCFSNADRVGPVARKKLSGILKHYAKEKKPFTACVKDNTKRFGKDRAERICAVIKDIIRGTTHWRGHNNPKDKGTPGVAGLSEEELVVEFALEIDDVIAAYLEEFIDEEYENMTAELAEGDLIWNPGSGYDALRRKVQDALNTAYPVNSNGEVSFGSSYWVEDIAASKALVCAGSEYYVAPFTDAGDLVELAVKSDWKPVEKAWVETHLAETPQVMAEMYFGSSEAIEEDGLIWKTILREGEWAYSPGAGQTPVAKPITVIKAGPSSAKKNVISMEELKTNFEAGAVQHVTVPTSHADKVDENTGFVKSLRYGKDEEGRHILEAGIEFTEPDVKEKAIRGSIANVSSGILFDYINKESGTKFGSVLGHAALTNHPWLTGMKPFGVEASEDLTVVGFSEAAVEEAPASDLTTTPKTGGNEMPEVTEATPINFEETFGLSEDGIRAMIERNARLEADNKRNGVNTKVTAWEAEGKTPAVVKIAKDLLMSDDGTSSINFAEGDEVKSLTLSEVVDRLVAATPNIKLAEEKVKDKDASEEKPVDDTDLENVFAGFSVDQKSDVHQLMFEEKMPQEAAIKKVAADAKNAA